MALLLSVIPKLPTTNLEATKKFYSEKLKFMQAGRTYPEYLMMGRDQIEIHFFLFRELKATENYGMCYIRVPDVSALFEELKHHFPGLKPPDTKPWGQKEFSLIDPDHNLLTFGEGA